jgi:hypothetical protein
MKIDNIKEEVTYDMENLRKKNETEIQNKMEGHSSRLEQAEDRISELEGEMVIKGKTKEREEVQAKGICNIVNKIIAENFPNLEKTMPI